ncbi:MAG: CBS domain-containing protein [Campylobacterota bacterium]|nr:CBS domain-containing protein [Campylobacterota bacterium]
MFAMYDDDGLNFRNTIDHLYNLHKVTSSEPIKNDTDGKNKQGFEEKLYQGKITEDAINKYKQVTNLDTTVEIFHVEQVMSHHVTTVNDSQTIQECYNLMEEYKVQQLPVIADSALHLKGMITKHDILRHLVEDINYANKNINKHIYEISTKKILTTDPISDIRRVAKVMLDFNLNAIPVVNSEDILVGMVTRHDIVKAVSTIPHMQIWA